MMMSMYDLPHFFPDYCFQQLVLENTSYARSLQGLAGSQFSSSQGASNHNHQRSAGTRWQLRRDKAVVQVLRSYRCLALKKFLVFTTKIQD